MKLRDHTFLEMTQSLCPECLALVPAKIITDGSSLAGSGTDSLRPGNRRELG